MITDLHLQHFRSYKDANFNFKPGVNIIAGPNASGKTNLLEALLLISIGHPYRGGLSEVVAFNKSWARLEANTTKDKRIVKLETTETGAKKEFNINGQIFARLSLARTLPLVLFEPEHLQLLSGKPELRRTFLDDILEQTIPGYARLGLDYQRALRQRNYLLKSGPSTSSQMFAWNIRLSELGGQVVVRRNELIRSIDQSITKLYRNLTDSRAKLAVTYVPTCQIDNYSTDMLHKLESHMAKDYERGFTSYGPHRDDFQILLNGHNAQLAASRGEMRSLLLTLKMLELQRIESLRQQKPLLLLDDVFSELDESRRQALTAFLSGYQTFITTTDADLVIPSFTKKANIVSTNN